MMVSKFWTSVVMGAFAVATAACSGNIGGSVDDDELIEQSEAELRRTVNPAKELVITDPSVIEAPVETSFDARYASGNDRRGAWSFGRLVHNMLPRDDRGDARAASRFVFGWLGQWETNQAPNPSPLVTSVSGARSRIREQLIDPWKAASGCTGSDEDCVLDMGKAPFRLIAIVYRPDLRKLATADSPAMGGEGRFVFTALDASGKPVKNIFIFEYSLPVQSNLGILAWAYKWHVLGALPFGEGYNAWLRVVTNGFAGPDTDWRRPNGNAINQIRTNELALKHRSGCHPDGTSLPTGLCKPAEATAAPTQKLWEMREFHLTTGGLVQAPVAQEPSRDFDVAVRKDGERVIGSSANKALLAQYLVENAAAIRAGTHKIPSEWLANSSYVGSGVPAWGTGGTFSYTDASGATQTAAPDVVRAFALNTCAGCHRHEVPNAGVAPTATFMHLADPRSLDPAEANDQAAIAAAAGGRATIMSDLLAKEIAAGGPRNVDYQKLLVTKPWELCNYAGPRICG